MYVSQKTPRMPSKYLPRSANSAIRHECSGFSSASHLMLDIQCDLQENSCTVSFSFHLNFHHQQARECNRAEISTRSSQDARQILCLELRIKLSSPQLALRSRKLSFLKRPLACIHIGLNMFPFTSPHSCSDTFTNRMYQIDSMTELDVSSFSIFYI